MVEGEAVVVEEEVVVVKGLEGGGGGESVLARFTATDSMSHFKPLLKTFSNIRGKSEEHRRCPLDTSGE